MNIVGIGTDIVSIARIQKIWDRFGMHFARRILTERELADLSKTQDPIAFLAKRYAAKEAVSKAFGTGFRPEGLLLTEIGVNRDALGGPHLHFMGDAEKKMKRLNVVKSYLSLSDEKEFALAFVILLG